MSYSQSKKLTDTEKRLEALKTQLFGKEGNKISEHHKNAMAATTVSPAISFHYHQEVSYLKNDLRKIFTLAAIALVVQLTLYLQFTFRILKFN